jgi:hypothetical protein
MNLLIIQPSPVSRHFLRFRSKFSPHHPVHSLSSSLIVRNQVSHPYKTGNKKHK